MPLRALAVISSKVCSRTNENKIPQSYITARNLLRFNDLKVNRPNIYKLELARPPTHFAEPLGRTASRRHCRLPTSPPARRART